MITFTVQPIIEFKTRQKVNKLIRNGKCLIDDFLVNIKKDNNLSPELDVIIANLEDIADGKSLPKTRYRRLNLSSKLKFTPYEVKSSNLRIYLIHEKETGQILIIGGKKSTQEKDLKKLEKLIKDYTQFKLSL